MEEKKDEQEEEVPADLGIKIESKDKIFWTRVRDSAKKEIELSEQTIDLNREIVVVAVRRLFELERRTQ